MNSSPSTRSTASDETDRARELIELGTTLEKAQVAGSRNVLGVAFHAGWVLAYLHYIYAGTAVFGAALIAFPHNPKHLRQRDGGHSL